LVPVIVTLVAPAAAPLAGAMAVTVGKETKVTLVKTAVAGEWPFRSE
jgi:hypothetical protein